MSDPQPYNFPFSGVVGADGNLSIPLTGFQAGIWVSWTVNLVATIGLFSVNAGGSPIAGPIPIHNGGATLGPMLTYGSQGASVEISAGNPGDQITGIAYGISSLDPNDLTANAGQSYSAVGQSTSYDGQNLITVDGNTTFGGDPTFPLNPAVGDPVTFDVRNYASVLLGLRLNSGGPLLITFRWFQNPDASRLVGQRAMILDQIVATAIATIPNLGPYLQVVVNRITGGNFSWNASLVTSQRIVTDVFGGNFTPYLIEQYSVALGQNAGQNFPVGTLYAGPVFLSYFNHAGSPGNVTFNVDQMGSDGVYHALGLLNSQTLGAGGDSQNEIVLPAAPVRIRAATGVTVGTYTFDVLMFTTTTGST